VSAIPGYLTMREAAQRLQVSYAQCARYVENGLLNSVTIGSQKLVFASSIEGFKRPPRGNPDFRKRKPK
jgi:excisionase family DNA binding protein